MPTIFHQPTVGKLIPGQLTMTVSTNYIIQKNDQSKTRFISKYQKSDGGISTACKDNDQLITIVAMAMS